MNRISVLVSAEVIAFDTSYTVPISAAHKYNFPHLLFPLQPPSCFVVCLFLLDLKCQSAIYIPPISKLPHILGYIAFVDSYLSIIGTILLYTLNTLPI